MRRTVITLTALAMLSVACARDAGTPSQIKLIAHDSFVAGVNDQTFSAFTEQTGIEVEVIAAGDAGSLVNQAALSKDNPLADVLFGVDDTFLSRAIEEGIFRPHRAQGLDVVDETLHHPDDLVTPIDFGDVCINYDKALLDVVPATLDELRDPSVASQLTVEHPATSSPGLAFLLATVAEFGEDGWFRFWEDLRRGGVNVVSDWDTAYYTEFSRYGGPSPMVVSYASSPPAEVIFAEEPTDTAPTGVVTAGCYRQVEYAGVLDGTSHPEEAGRLIDFMLTVEFQEQVPLSWFVFPVNPDADLPPEFVDHTVVPENPARLDPEVVAENRDRWIREWVAVMEG